MLQIEEAQEMLCRQVKQTNHTRELALMDAVGWVLAEDLQAAEDQPPFARSPLDGYAVKGVETSGASGENPRTFRVVGKVCAGSVHVGTVGSGEAVRIMTGAPIPDGADTVIRQEDTDFAGTDLEAVQIFRESAPFENFCPKGEDYQKGELLIKSGTVLNGIAIGMLASMGITRVIVYEKPRVAVISTGDELVSPGTRLESGQIYDSNLYYVGGRLLELGVTPWFMGHCEDDPEKMTELVRTQISEADLIITIGGVSVGEKDIMHHTVELLNARKLFWGVQLKPGAPTLASVYQETLMISLSGNPYAAAANFELLVRPVLSAMTGDDRWNMKRHRAFLQNDFPKPGKVRRFLRGYTESGQVWVNDRNQASGALTALLMANCLIEIPPSQEGARAGVEVWVYML